MKHSTVWWVRGKSRDGSIVKKTAFWKEKTGIRKKRREWGKKEGCINKKRKKKEVSIIKDGCRYRKKKVFL